MRQRGVSGHRRFFVLGRTEEQREGDRCDNCPPPDCSPGGPRATMMIPSTQQVLPGAIEIAPQG